jgi:hypothetical protein
MKLLMKTPIDCPFCGDPLLNDFREAAGGIIYLTKTCNKRIDHTIKIRACRLDNDYVDWICIPYSDNTNVLWYMGTGSLILNNTSSGSDYRLPFFEPDLSNYKKLVQKIKIYLLFS